MPTRLCLISNRGTSCSEQSVVKSLYAREALRLAISKLTAPVPFVATLCAVQKSHFMRKAAHQ
jgi:hypothetical protein